LADDGGMDGPGRPRRRLRDKPLKQGAGSWADVVTTLRMPLHPEDEVRIRVVRVLTTLNCLNYRVLRATCRNPQPVSGNPDGLVVAGVDRKTQKTILLGCLGLRNHLSQDRLRSDGRRMGYGHRPARRMIHRHGRKILDQGATTPYIQRLGPEADRENRLIK